MCKEILKIFRTTLENDNPDHILLPGDSSRYLSISSIGLFPTQSHSSLISRAYTLTLWIRFDDISTSKNINLFHYKSATLEIEAIISKKSSNSQPNIYIRISFNATQTPNGVFVSHEMTGPIYIKMGT